MSPEEKEALAKIFKKLFKRIEDLEESIEDHNNRLMDFEHYELLNLKHDISRIEDDLDDLKP